MAAPNPATEIAAVTAARANYTDNRSKLLAVMAAVSPNPGDEIVARGTEILTNAFVAPKTYTEFLAAQIAAGQPQSRHRMAAAIAVIADNPGTIPDDSVCGIKLAEVTAIFTRAATTTFKVEGYYLEFAKKLFQPLEDAKRFFGVEKDEITERLRNGKDEITEILQKEENELNERLQNIERRQKENDELMKRLQKEKDELIRKMNAKSAEIYNPSKRRRCASYQIPPQTVTLHLHLSPPPMAAPNPATEILAANPGTEILAASAVPNPDFVSGRKLAVAAASAAAANAAQAAFAAQAAATAAQAAFVNEIERYYLELAKKLFEPLEDAKRAFAVEKDEIIERLQKENDEITERLLKEKDEITERLQKEKNEIIQRLQKEKDKITETLPKEKDGSQRGSSKKKMRSLRA